MVAGINAGFQAQGKEQRLILDRSDALTGVLIDDLISAGVDEPYRMFTSRAEFRLSVRADNADLRLSEKAIELGILPEDQEQAFRKKKELRDKSLGMLRTFTLSSKRWNTHGVPQINQEGAQNITAAEAIARPGVQLS